MLQAAVRYEPRPLFRTYLYGIALKQLAAERRKRLHRESEAPESDPPAAGNAETEVAVRQALAKLDEGLSPTLASIGRLRRIEREEITSLKKPSS